MPASKWQHVTDWYIDPAQTFGGHDENDGLTATTPLKSVAEWRRRISGSYYSGGARIVIHALSASTDLDDGKFYGFTTDKNSISSVVVIGTPVVVGTGTITSFTAPSGNGRCTISAASIPTSWTASGFVSTAADSRFIRKSGGGPVPHAYLISDQGTKTIQLGPVSTWNDSSTAAVAVFTESTFTTTDSFDVYSLPRWPMLQATENVLYQNLDVFGSPFVQINTANKQNRFILCGFVGTGATVVPTTGGNITFYACGFSGGPALFGDGTGMALCAFLAVLVQIVSATTTWKSQINVFVSCRLYVESGGLFGNSGTLRVFDSINPCIELSGRCSVYIEALVGTGNSGPLATVARGSQLYGAANMTASTTALHPYIIGGVSHDSPAVETTGDAVYA